MDIDKIKDKGITISIGTWVASIVITISLTTIFWNMKTLESRMDKRHERLKKEIKRIEKMKNCKDA